MQILDVPNKPRERLKYGGSFFDDLVKNGPTEEEINSLAIRTELNERHGAVIFVQNQEARRDFRKVLKYWHQIKELNHIPQVLLDESMPVSSIRIDQP